MEERQHIPYYIPYSEFVKSCNETLKARIDNTIKNRLSNDLKSYYSDHCPDVVKFEDYDLNKNTVKYDETDVKIAIMTKEETMRKTYRVFCSDCKKTTKINISYEMSNEINSDSLINYCPFCGHSFNSETLFKFEYSEYDTNFETGEHSSEVNVECYDEDIEHLIERFKEENFHLLYRNNEGEFPIVFWKSKGLPNQTTFRIVKSKHIQPDQDRITEEMNYY